MTDTPSPSDADPRRDPAAQDDAEPDDTDSAVSEMHRSGVGTQDPNLTSGPETELVDDQVQPDQPPEV